MSQGKNIVDKIYHKKSGGKLRKMLTVYSDGEKLRLNFLSWIGQIRLAQRNLKVLRQKE